MMSVEKAKTSARNISEKAICLIGVKWRPCKKIAKDLEDPAIRHNAKILY